MHPSELQLGDIIFFKNLIGDYTHVAMYTGDVDGKPYVTHSVINERPGVQSTILKDAGLIMDVCRSKNSELGVQAAQIMLGWTKYRIPYDARRAKWMLKVNDAMLGVGLKEDTREPIECVLDFLDKQAKIKFYERIKFAARRDTCPVKILADEIPRGFTCVQAVILAYQIAELIPYVKTISEIKLEMSKVAETVEQINEVWVSDKNCPQEILDTYSLPDSYIEYSFALRDPEEYSFFLDDKREPLMHPNYHPCLVAWRFDKEPSIDEFISKFDSCLNLPAKITFTDALYAYMNKHKNHWSFVGSVERELLQSNFSENEKLEHREKIMRLESLVEENRQVISFERRLSSPRLSSRSTSPYGLFSPLQLTNQLQGNVRNFPSDEFANLEALTIEERGRILTSPLLETKYPRLKH